MPPIPESRTPDPVIPSCEAAARDLLSSAPAPQSASTKYGLTAPSLTGQERPFRVKLRGSVLALVRLPNRRTVRGKLHQLSVTGGLINLEQPLDEKLDVELIFNLGETTIREKAQMMFPMWATQGWLQPFRFVDLPDARKDDLEKCLLAFLQGTPESSS
jgi:hypothetical protein